LFCLLVIRFLFIFGGVVGRIQILFSLSLIAVVTLACGFSIGDVEDPTPIPEAENTPVEQREEISPLGMVVILNL